MAGRNRKSVQAQEAIFEDALLYMKGNPLFKRKNRLSEQVRDLTNRFPELPGQLIADALGFSKQHINRVRAALQPQFEKPEEDEDEDEHRHEMNIKSSAAELMALQASGGRYEDDPRSEFEDNLVRGPTLLISNDTAHYKADQSHTVKRPITLPTTPFNHAA